MTPTEILIKVREGEINLKDLKRSRGLFAVAFDEEAKCGYLGFIDGKILQVSPEKYDLYLSFASVMREGYVYNVASKGQSPEKKVNTFVKLIKRITVENQAY